MIIKVQNSNDAERLDSFLSRKLNISRNQIQKLLAENKISVNKNFKKAHYLLKKDDQIKIFIPKPKKLNIKAKKIPLDIIYEDDDVIVINKQPFIVMHPQDTGNHGTNTIVNALLSHCKKSLSGIGGVMRPGIVHRLDKDTSGVLIIAKNDKAHHFLSEQIKNRTIKKTYIALIKGKLMPLEGKIEAPIARDSLNRKKMAVSPSKTARSAITEYKVIKHFISPLPCTLVEVHPITGRTHQIRVHFAAIGHPIIGDSTYGSAKANKIFIQQGVARQFLHAQKLEIKIPKFSQKKTFIAPLAPDLKHFFSSQSFSLSL